LEVNYNEFLLQTEYIWDQGAYNTGAGGGCGSEPMLLGEKRGGFYAQAMYLFPINLQPVVKVEMFDQDLDNDLSITNVDKISTLTFGFNYFFNESTRLQVNYLYNAEKGIGNINAEKPNDALLMQLQVRF